METMDVLLWLKENHELSTQTFQMGILPTVLIPLTAVTVVLTSVASIIAGWFGIKLHTEGPKQLLEVLLKKRVLITMVFLNILFYGGYKAYQYIKTYPKFIMTITRHSDNEAVASSLVYENAITRNHSFDGKIAPVSFSKLEFEKSIKLPKGAFRSGVVSGSSIFYGVDDGYIYEINQSDLTIIRKFYVGTQVTTRPVIFNGKIYTGEGNHYTHHARIYSFDLKTGKYLNSQRTLGHTEGQQYVGTYNGKNLVFATAGLDGVYALDPENLNIVWHQNDGHLDATVSVENNRVYIGTGVEKGTLRDRSYAVAYDFLSGAKIWKKELPLSNWMHPIITKTDVCYVLGEIYFNSKVGLFHCLNKQSGAPHFSIPFESPLASLPYYINDGVEEMAFFASFDGTACAVNITKKETMWCHKTGNGKTDYSLSSFEFDSKRGVLWYPTLDNGIFAFEVKTGKVLAHWLPDGKKDKWEENYASVNIVGDSLYLLDIAGNLRKFKLL